MNRTRILLLALLTVFSLSACEGQWWHNLPGYGGFWWQRGQPQSVDQLVTASKTHFEANLTQFHTQRAALAPLVDEIGKNLLNAYSASRGPGINKIDLTAAEALFIGLEDQLSVGSRAAYGELSGQMRAFSSRLKNASPSDEILRESFGLYTSRVLSFMANELSVPPPVLG